MYTYHISEISAKNPFLALNVVESKILLFTMVDWWIPKAFLMRLYEITSGYVYQAVLPLKFSIFFFQHIDMNECVICTPTNKIKKRSKAKDSNEAASYHLIQTDTGFFGSITSIQILLFFLIDLPCCRDFYIAQRGKLNKKQIEHVGKLN